MSGKGSGWSFTTDFTITGPKSFAFVQGHAIPRVIEATWTRNDGLEVLLVVEIREGQPVPMKATVSRSDGIAGVSRLPFLWMAQETASRLAFRPGEESGTWIAPRPATNQLQTVADLYREAIQLGEPVNQWIRNGLAAREIYRSPGTINRLIYQARRTKGPDRKTYLPRTRPGRKHA